jgi:hypothetical protein
LQGKELAHFIIINIATSASSPFAPASTSTLAQADARLSATSSHLSDVPAAANSPAALTAVHCPASSSGRSSSPPPSTLAEAAPLTVIKELQKHLLHKELVAQKALNEQLKQGQADLRKTIQKFKSQDKDKTLPAAVGAWCLLRARAKSTLKR